MSGATIYVLRCADGSYYTGITRRDLAQRVGEHEQGLDKNCYTASRRPLRLVFCETYERVDEAVARGRQIKGWSRAKKEALIRHDYSGLPALSARRT